MKNFILLYHLTNERDNEFFKNELKKKFPEHKIDQYRNLEYFTFPARHQPAVKDEIASIANKLSIGTKDYIALYFTRPKNDDEIAREMLLGHDRLLETLDKKIVPAHNRNLIDLMNYVFPKQRKN